MPNMILPWMADTAVKNTFDRLSSMDQTVWISMFDDLAGASITEVEIEFTVRLLKANQTRLTETLRNVVK